MMTFMLLSLLCNILWASFAAGEPPTTEAPTRKTWALLVAGSDQYFNYRHQADICHAYQILRENGIPAENIVTMMKDDIAYNRANPTPGVIINVPNGPNVYKGVNKDYTGDDVNPMNFLSILRGDKKAMEKIGSGRVIESGPNDYLFVYFSDHGAPFMLCFPKERLHAVDLNAVLNRMAENKQFYKMYFFVEACFSGSMFDNTLNDTENIFVMTAADISESSVACYRDEYRDVYLADVFSANWMHQAEAEPLNSVDFHHLFQKVRTNTTTSHVEEYGDLDIGNTIVSNVFGSSNTFSGKKSDGFVDSFEDVIPQSDAKLASLEMKLKKMIKSNNHLAIRRLKTLILHETTKRFVHMNKLNSIIAIITDGDKEKINMLEKKGYNLDKKEMKCYKEIVEYYFSICLNISEGELVYPYLTYFVRACKAQWTNTKAIINAINSVCKN